MIKRNKPLRRSRKPIPKKRKGGPRRGAKKNDDHRAFIRSLPCLICYRVFWDWMAEDRSDFLQWQLFKKFDKQKWAMGCQSSRTECAHVGFEASVRGLGQKYPDDESLPLCRVDHHQFGPKSIHKLQAGPFFAFHRLDRDGSIRLMQRLFRLTQERPEDEDVFGSA